VRGRRSFRWIGVLALVAGALAVPEHAGAVVDSFLPSVTGLCGTATMVARPADLRPGGLVDRTIRVIPEHAQDATNQFPLQLTSPVPVDIQSVGVYDRPSSLPSPKPVLPVDSTVASFLVHWDPGASSSTGAVRRTVTVGFDHRILGVQILPQTVQSIAAQQFHAADLTYPPVISGLQLSSNGQGDVVRVLDPYTVSLTFTATSGVKELRIITWNEFVDRPAGNITAGPRKATVPPSGSGFSMLAADGGVFVFDPDGGYWGSLGGLHLNQPIVGGVRTCSGEGYWLVARDGGVFSFGDATFHGSLGGRPPTSRVVAMSATPTGNGYYLVTATGQVYAFGDAHHHGDTHTLALTKPIVGIASTPTGDGYWLVASDGGIFAFGDARFDGSTGAIRLNRPIIAMRAAPSGDGYWLLASDGGIFTFSSNQPGADPTPFFGSAGNSGDPNPFVGMSLAADGQGYWLTDSIGNARGYGPSTPSDPGMSRTRLASPVIGTL